MAMKRKRAVRKFSARSRKKARPVRRSARNNVTSSSRSLTATNMRRPRKMMSKRKYRSMLYRNTMHMTKFNSVLTSSSTISASATPDLSVFQLVPVFSNTNPFWKSGGGLRPQTPGAAATTITPIHLIIRGGVFQLDLVNTDPNFTVYIKVQLVWPKSQRDQLGSSSTATNVPLNDWLASSTTLVTAGFNYDFTNNPDYSSYFYPPVMGKEFQLRALETMNIKHKIKPTRLDPDLFTSQGGYFPSWVVQVNCPSSSAAVVRCVDGYNLSFCVIDA